MLWSCGRVLDIELCCPGCSDCHCPDPEQREWGHTCRVRAVGHPSMVWFTAVVVAMHFTSSQGLAVISLRGKTPWGRARLPEASRTTVPLWLPLKELSAIGRQIPILPCCDVVQLLWNEGLGVWTAFLWYFWSRRRLCHQMSFKEKSQLREGLYSLS